MQPFQPPTADTVSRRWVSVFLFLTIFFLPLHFHAAVASPQLAKECGCIHGSRTEAGLAAPPAGCVPVIAYQIIEFRSKTVLVFHPVPSKASRAPPSLASL